MGAGGKAAGSWIGDRGLFAGSGSGYPATQYINIPTTALNKATYLAPFDPIEVRKITGNGKPYFCEGLPIKFAKM